MVIGGESNALSSYQSLKNVLKSDQATSKVGTSSTGLSSMQYKQTSEQVDKNQAGVIISQFVPKMPSPSPRSRENYKMSSGAGNHSHRVVNQGNFSNKMNSNRHPSKGHQQVLGNKGTKANNRYQNYNEYASQNSFQSQKYHRTLSGSLHKAPPS